MKMGPKWSLSKQYIFVKAVSFWSDFKQEKNNTKPLKDYFYPFFPMNMYLLWIW